MSKILVTNIGNRNITYKGKVYQDIYNKNEKGQDYKTFYVWSQWLEENYDSEKEFLDINIFNPLVVDEPRPDKIVLIYSDQSFLDTRTDQDTIYEAKILKCILKDRYGYADEQVELKHINAKVVETGSLMLEYRKLINAIKKQGYDKIIICDAGGTAQQKMALKIMAEYLLDAEQYEVKYAENNKIVTDVCMMEYRSVIDKEQAIQLIRKGQFWSAYQLSSGEFDPYYPPRNTYVAILMHTILRYNGNDELVKHWLNSVKINKKNKLLVDLKNGIVYADCPQMKNYFNSYWAHLVDKLYKVNFLLNLKMYSECILSLSQFYELFLEKAIELKKLNFGKRNKQTSVEIENLQQFFSENYKNLLTDDFKIEIGYLNTQILIGKIVFDGPLKEFCNELSPYISYTDDSKDGCQINNIRNAIAHKGLFITETDFNLKYKYVEKLIIKLNEILGLTKYDLFEEYTILLEEHLRY